MPKDRTSSIRGFKGLDERLDIGTSLELTTSLDNVIVRNGTVKGRKGLSLWDGISTPASNTIIGINDFYAANTSASQLVRMTTAKFEVWNHNALPIPAWEDHTGSPLNGTTLDRPVFATMSDEGFLVFTNEGHNRPRKWTGSGDSIELGGTPPFAKAMEPWLGFLFLGNISQDGSFSNMADALTIQFSDVPDVNWDLCEENTLVLDESLGDIRALKSFGTNLIAFKSDCIVQIRFVQGKVRFARQRLPFAIGCLASMSVRSCGEFGIIFLGTDRNLYRTDGFQVIPLPKNVQKSLQEVMNVAKAPFVSAYVDTTRETYHLLYQRNSSTYFDGRLSYNYRTGEFYRGAYTGFEFTRAHAYRQTNNTDTQLVVAASDNKVYEQENGTDDAGTAVSRIYDVDWNQYGGSKSQYFTGARLVFTRATNVQVRVSVAANHSHLFQFPRMKTLKGKFPSDDNAELIYEVPSPIYGSWFKLRIELFHYGSTNVAEMLECEPRIIPVHEAPQNTPKQPQTQRS